MLVDWLDPVTHNLGYLFQAASLTVLLSLLVVVPATLLGVLIAALQTRHWKALDAVVMAYLFLMRGVPLLILLTFAYYLMPLTGFDMAPLWSVALVLSIYYAAFMSEVFRAGIESLPRAQWDAARSLGMRRGQLLRLVIFPQAMRMAGPAYLNLCVSLVKSTSLASIVGLFELTRAGREIVERTLAPFQVLLASALVYFVICYGLARYGKRLERRVLAGQ